VRTDLEDFHGEVDDRAAFTGWFMDEVDAEVKRVAGTRLRERMQSEKLAAMYEVGKRSVFAGIWSVLKDCRDDAVDSSDGAKNTALILPAVAY
jgi:hypothetical protein